MKPKMIPLATPSGIRWAPALSDPRRPLVIVATLNATERERAPFTVTHVPTGRAAAFYASMKAAREVVRTLLPLTNWRAVGNAGTGGLPKRDARRIVAARKRLMARGLVLDRVVSP